MQNRQDSEQSLLQLTIETLKSKFNHISDEEIDRITQHWQNRFEDDDDLDAGRSLHNLQFIIENLERNEKSTDGKYHKSDFEHIMLYLKGQLTPIQLGLVEYNTFFFGFEGTGFTKFPEGSGFNKFPEFTTFKDQLSTIGYLFSGRFNRADNIENPQINFLSRNQRFTDNQDPIISNSDLALFGDCHSFLSDFIDSHSICQLSWSQQNALVEILNDINLPRILQKNLEQIRKDKPDSYYSEVLNEALSRFEEKSTFDQMFKEFLIQDQWKSLSSENKKQLFRLMNEDDDFKQDIISKLNIATRREYYQYLVDQNSCFKKANPIAQRKIKECFLDIPKELIGLLMLTLKDVENWRVKEISQSADQKLLKDIDLENKDTDRSQLKLFAYLDENGNFIMGSSNRENHQLKLISGLKISKDGIMEIGRFDEKGKFVINAYDQERLFEGFKKSSIFSGHQNGIEVATRIIDALKRFDLQEAKVGLLRKGQGKFISLEEIDGKWFLGEKDSNLKKSGVVLTKNGVEEFSGNDQEIRTNDPYRPWSEDLTPPPPPPARITNPDNFSETEVKDKLPTPTLPRNTLPPVELPSTILSDNTNPNIPTKPQPPLIAQPEDEAVRVNCCGLFSRMRRIRERMMSSQILPNAGTIAAEAAKALKQTGRFRF